MVLCYCFFRLSPVNNTWTYKVQGSVVPLWQHFDIKVQKPLQTLAIIAVSQKLLLHLSNHCCIPAVPLLYYLSNTTTVMKVQLGIEFYYKFTKFESDLIDLSHNVHSSVAIALGDFCCNL